MTTNILFWRLQQFQRSGSNLGDRAISDAMFASISEAVPSAKFYVYTRNREFLPPQYNVEGINILSVTGIFKGLRALLKADIVILGGGTIIQDKSSKLVIVFNLSFAVIAILLRKKVMCYAIGLGGADEISRSSRWLSRFVLNRCKMITLRDPESAEMLEEIGVRRAAHIVTSDAAVLLKQAADEDITDLLNSLPINRRANKVVAISLRRVFHRSGGILPVSVKIKMGLMGRQWQIKIEEFKNEMASIIDEIIEKYSAHIIFVPMYTGESFFSPRDDLFIESVVFRLKNHRSATILKEGYSPSQIKTLFSHVDLVIGVPLHAVVLAITAGTPAISLGYADKNVRFMRMIGMEEMLVDVRQFGTKIERDKFMELVDFCFKNAEQIKHSLKGKNNLLREKCQKNTLALLSILGQSE